MDCPGSSDADSDVTYGVEAVRADSVIEAATAAFNDDITEKLSATGTEVGLAAAAAVSSAKKRQRAYQFETNPSLRKRHQSRLQRKLRHTVDEYCIRVGQQCVVIFASSAENNQHLKVFGASPLNHVVRSQEYELMQNLARELALTKGESHLQYSLGRGLPCSLPVLNVDGIPTSLDAMTQAQLRAFIPIMLKCSTGRGKPGWGKTSHKPKWWPDDVPWANIRSDQRSDEMKSKLHWSQALRLVVKSCYQYHGQEDLLPTFEPSSSGRVIREPKQKERESTTIAETLPQGYEHAGTSQEAAVAYLQLDTGSYVTLADGTQARIMQQVPAVNARGLEHGEQLDAESDGQSNVSTEIRYTAAFEQDGQVTLQPAPEGTQVMALPAMNSVMYGFVQGSNGLQLVQTTPNAVADVSAARSDSDAPTSAADNKG